jgi:hypothetical protein
MNRPMNQPAGHDFDQDLARALAPGKSVPVAGFAARAQRARALAASDESAQLADLLGVAEELAVLTPVVDRHVVVEALLTPDL